MDRPGCLLVHGYGGTPFEMEGIAAALAGAGYAVNNLCLPGHGQDRDRFRETRFHHWLDHAENAYSAMLARHGRVFLLGFSMGGALALNIAARRGAAGVMTISAVVYVMQILPWPLVNARFYRDSLKVRVRKLLPFSPPVGDTGETSQDIAPWKGYTGRLNFPQLWSFRKGCAQTRDLLPSLTAPLCVMHDVGDKLVYVGNAWEVARRASSERTEIRLTRMRETITSHHMVPTHRETAVFAASEAVRFAQSL